MLLGLSLCLSNQCFKFVHEGNVLFNDALNTFYLRLYGFRHMVKDHSDSEKGTRCRHYIDYFRLAARVLLYASSHIHDSEYHIYYTSRGALTGTRNSSVGPLLRIDPLTHLTMSGSSTTELHLAPSLLAARVLLYAPSQRQDSTYHGLCYTSRGALAGTRNSCLSCFIAVTIDDK